MTSPTRWSGELPEPKRGGHGELIWRPGYTVNGAMLCNGYRSKTELHGIIHLNRDNAVTMTVHCGAFLIAPEHLEPLAAALLAAAEIVKQREAENEQS